MKTKQYVEKIEANRKRVAKEYKAAMAKYASKPKHKIVTNEDGSVSVVKIK